MSEEKNKKKLDQIKSGVFSRSSSLAKLSAKAGSKVLTYGISKIFNSADKNQRLWLELLSQQAKNWSEEISELKGSLMKALQMLSMYGEYFFPPEVNKYFKSLQQDSSPLRWETIKPVIIEYLGKEKFDSLVIEEEPIACASLGQVHRATIRQTHEEIVLKIQYPNIEKAIDSDIKTLKTFLQIIKIIPSELNLDDLLNEIKEMLHQESDYEQEASKTEKFRQLLINDHRFIVPKVYPEYSSHKIIALSYEHGLRIEDPLIQSLSQARRNHLAENFLDLYFRELFIWKELQTDPHSGNYKIRLDSKGNDQWVLYDFGATKNYPDSFFNSYYQLIKASLRNDRKLLTLAAEDLKFLFEGDDPQLVKLFEEFCMETIEPFLDHNDPRQKGPIDSEGNYDWKNTDLPHRLTSKVIHILKKYKLRPPPKEILFLDRKTGGVFIIMVLLKAKMRAQPVLLKYLDRV